MIMSTAALETYGKAEGRHCLWEKGEIVESLKTIKRKNSARF